ncbi:MAG: glutathione S-transferase family protein [Xanthomonadales bacterium]|nr:glutathione S-transferase family protein [Xanthomonadales bacterium]
MVNVDPRAGYTLYAAECSLYSGKLRSYLRKKGIAYREIAPSVLTYKRFIVPRTGVSYIPVLHTPDDEVWQDTTEIIDRLEARHPDPAVYPESPCQRLVSLLLEVYGDEWLLIPAMHYRWNFPDDNLPFLHDEFGGVAFPWLPRFLRRRLGRRVAARFAGFVPGLGITEDTIPAIEASYRALLDDLDVHFRRHDFLLGSRPSIGDFGLIGPLYAHLYRDPHPGRLMRERAPAVAAWVEGMTDEQPVEGDFLPGDAVPETLLPVLQRMVREQMPVLADTAVRLAQWRESHPEERTIPRALGEHDFDIEGVQGRRKVLPFSLWMWQRVLDFYRGLSREQRDGVAELLDEIDAKPFLERSWPVRVDRRDNRFVIL